MKATAVYNTVQRPHMEHLEPRLLLEGAHLEWSTFLNSDARDMTTDSLGNLYAVGGDVNVTVVKLSSDGRTELYTRELEAGKGYAIAVDSEGCAYVTGIANSYEYPTTPGAYDPVADAGMVFVTKLSADGSALLYSTMIGRSEVDFSDQTEYMGIAVKDGCAYITGYTESTDFPTTSGAFDRTYNGGDVWAQEDDDAPDAGDAFVTKLNPTGTGLVYSTFLGGSDMDSAHDIAVDGAGCAYVTGTTMSMNFPANAFDRSQSACTDAFVTKLNASGSALVYSTFLGGVDGGFNEGHAIAVDSLGRAYVTGEACSERFPTTTGAYDRTHNGEPMDAFITALRPDGRALVFSTFFGGTGWDVGTGIGVLDDGCVAVTGYTESTDLPTTEDAWDRMFAGGSVSGDPHADAFLVKVTPQANALLYSTYLGHTGHDSGLALAVVPGSVAVVAGITDSELFPTTPGVVHPAYPWEVETTGFVSVFSLPHLSEWMVTLGVGYVPRLKFTDADGTRITVTETKGVASVRLTGQDLLPVPGSLEIRVTGANVAIDSITLSQTTSASTTSIAAIGGDSLAAVGAIHGTGLAGSLNARAADLTGVGIDLTDGCFGSIILHDLKNGADVKMPRQGYAGGIAITAGRLMDGTDVLLGSWLKGLTAVEWRTGVLVAPYAKAISITGSRTVPGDLGADLVLTEQGTDGFSIGTLSVKRWIDASQILSGSVKSVTAGGMRNVTLFAGVADTRDEQGAGGVADAVLDLPVFAADIPYSDAKVQALTLKGIRDAAGKYIESFINSNVAASHLGRISLAYARFDNDGVPAHDVPFGLAARELPDALTYRDGKRWYTWKPAGGTNLPAYFDDLLLRVL